MIKGLLISVHDNEVYEIMLDKKSMLKDLYGVIGTNVIDVVRRVYIGDTLYDIIVDDEGLLKEDRKPSARCDDAEQVLFGNIVVVRGNEETGEFDTLENFDIDNIQNHIFGLHDRNTNELSPFLTYTYNKELDNDIEVDRKRVA